MRVMPTGQLPELRAVPSYSFIEQADNIEVITWMMSMATLHDVTICNRVSFVPSIRGMSWTHCNWQGQHDRAVPVQQLQIEIE